MHKYVSPLKWEQQPIAGDAYRDRVVEPTETDERSQATPPLT